MLRRGSEETKEAFYAAGRSSVTLPAESRFAGSGTANKMAIMATNAASDIKLSTRTFSSKSAVDIPALLTLE